MQVQLTEAQLKKIIELLRKSQVSRADGDLITYLTRYVTPAKVSSIDYDEIPF